MKWSREKLDAKRDEYYRRKASRLCVSCEAGLQARDGVRCVECRAASNATTSAWSARKVKSRGPAAIKARYRANRDAALADRRLSYAELRAAEICTRCRCESATEGALCSTCKPLERARIRATAAARRARDPQAANRRLREWRERRRDQRKHVVDGYTVDRSNAIEQSALRAVRSATAPPS